MRKGLRGTVSLSPDPRLPDIDLLAQHFTGRPYADREHPRVTAWLTVEAYHAWDFTG
ncbi:hypothetical protein O7632_28880 [Solwaraspora sp. WMMD406]|uniref:hypothetical protein n=1 Tax=Solwaraspora sp. WMMD406 TaxID=3016095 RepID=UPI00241610F2|nr:hypothetical protein [Solwaraspora sp. WMMD406]MDG4768075.1 hypothetical protein [Solwaraspora sp. WMMD406]